MEAVPGLRQAVVSEYHRVVRPPWEIPTALVTNGALMVAAWFLLPPRAHAFMFSLNGPLAFPVILASWMLADTPATNVMGSSPALALSVLEDQAAYWRWLAARCIVIGSLIGVACAAGVMYVGVGHYPWSGDRVGLRARRLSAGGSSPGCRLARHRVPFPRALPALALAAPPSLA